MNELLKKIYEEIICEEEEAVLLSCEADEKIMQLIKPCHADNLSIHEQEELKQLLYTAVLIGKQTGFEIGFKTALKIIT